MNIPQTLRDEVGAFTAFLDSPIRAEPDQYEIVESRLDCLRFLIRSLEFSPDDLPTCQEWFRSQTDPWCMRSPMLSRARTWPEGYPGDYRTIEGVYANQPAGDGVGRHLDRYFLSRTLAVSIRSRCRRLAELLATRTAHEPAGSKWLDLACGSCRELLAVPPASNGRSIYCVDSDPNALQYAENLLAGRDLGDLHFLAENAMRFGRAKANVQRFGEFSTIYSAGLFDYIPTTSLASLLEGLYHSLAPGGVLIAPFKDSTRYETFDYHWLARWHFFFQREEPEFRAVFGAAGVPEDAITVERDDTGVLLFFTIRK
jgi:extracellular factor (EF) 3-hydroxypalmitic acid methyl ester biosynthesis protein